MDFRFQLDEKPCMRLKANCKEEWPTKVKNTREIAEQTNNTRLKGVITGLSIKHCWFLAALGVEIGAIMADILFVQYVSKSY